MDFTISNYLPSIDKMEFGRINDANSMLEFLNNECENGMFTHLITKIPKTTQEYNNVMDEILYSPPRISLPKGGIKYKQAEKEYAKTKNIHAYNKVMKELKEKYS